MKSIQAVLLACIAAALFGVSQAQFNNYSYQSIGEGYCRDKNENEYSTFHSIFLENIVDCKNRCECVEGEVPGAKLRGLTYISKTINVCLCYVDPLDLASGASYCGATFTGKAPGIGEVEGFSNSDNQENITCYRKVSLGGGGGGGNGGGGNNEGSYSMSYNSKGGKSGGGSSKGGKGGSSMSYGSYSGKASKSSSKGGKGGSSMSYAYGGKGGKRA